MEVRKASLNLQMIGRLSLGLVSFDCLVFAGKYVSPVFPTQFTVSAEHFDMK